MKLSLREDNLVATRLVLCDHKIEATILKPKPVTTVTGSSHTTTTARYCVFLPLFIEPFGFVEVEFYEEKKKMKIVAKADFLACGNLEIDHEAVFTPLEVEATTTAVCVTGESRTIHRKAYVFHILTTRGKVEYEVEDEAHI